MIEYILVKSHNLNRYLCDQHDTKKMVSQCLHSKLVLKDFWRCCGLSGFPRAREGSSQSSLPLRGQPLQRPSCQEWKRWRYGQNKRQPSWPDQKHPNYSSLCKYASSLPTNAVLLISAPLSILLWVLYAHICFQFLFSIWGKKK